jgi:hypothetical protein
MGLPGANQRELTEAYCETGAKSSKEPVEGFRENRSRAGARPTEESDRRNVGGRRNLVVVCTGFELYIIADGGVG